MTDDARDKGWLYGGTLAASFAVHALAAALLIFGLPVSLPESDAPPAINVDLVPPPEPAAEAKPEPPAPEPPAPEPPAPEPPAPEPPVQAEPPPPPPAAETRAQQSPEIEVLNPVYQYGEKDAGPADATDGNAAQDSPAEPTPEGAEEPAPEMPEATPQPEEPTAQAEAQAEPPPEPDAESVASDAEPAAPEMAEAPREGSTAPEVLSNPGQPDLADLPAAAQPEPVEDLPVVVAQLPAPRPTPPRAAETAPDLQRAQRIFSRPAIVNPEATVAMGNMPRGVRAGNLCVTELREQLRNGMPPYYPDLLPRLRLDGEGRVLNQPRTEFRMGGQWYNLSLRCTVDAGATRVTNFAYRVGDAVPRSEWAGRRLPGR
jgi:hypothetical protein